MLGDATRFVLHLAGVGQGSKGIFLPALSGA
jgi:hypothetical protein